MDILMPQLGETVAEGKITVWFKSVGDAVKPGDNLFEIETDKTSMEVPATSPACSRKSACRPARSPGRRRGGGDHAAARRRLRRSAPAAAATG